MALMDPTPQPLQHAQDDVCADELGSTVVRNIFVRRVGEALNDDGEVVPLQPAPAAPGTRATKRSTKRSTKRKDR
jgi:hypothetical protein